jgi:hypothetical protein
MSNAHKAGFVLAAYFAFGISLVPMQPQLMPLFQSVTFKECRKHCGTTPDGRYACATVCSTTVGKREPTKATNAPPHGSTGPTVPPKPVSHY